jgi:hypothetical protein
MGVRYLLPGKHSSDRLRGGDCTDLVEHVRLAFLARTNMGFSWA